jgi:hypothetical protein
MMPGSALIGAPPETEADFWIVRSLLLTAGLKDADPKKGAHIPPFRPPPDQYQYDTRGPIFVTGSIVALILMLLFTTARLLLRSLKSGLQWGWDDWVIIPGVVRWPRGERRRTTSS